MKFGISTLIIKSGQSVEKIPLLGKYFQNIELTFSPYLKYNDFNYLKIFSLGKATHSRTLCLPLFKWSTYSSNIFPHSQSSSAIWSNQYNHLSYGTDETHPIHYIVPSFRMDHFNTQRTDIYPAREENREKLPASDTLHHVAYQLYFFSNGI